MEERNTRTVMLIGEDSFNKIKNSKVAVFGLGGVGGYAVEALARAGVGEIHLIDNDKISESNINRQIIATYETLGTYKTDAFEKRIASINPHCHVEKFTQFVTPENLSEFDLALYDYVIDAIDTVSAKIALAVLCEKSETKLISSMGTGNKLDPTNFEVSDIYKTSVCPLARVMRYELKKRGVKKLKVVYSKEEAIKPLANPNPTSEDEKNKKNTPASISFVPSVAGLILAKEVITDIISD